MKILHVLSDRTAQGGVPIFALDVIFALHERGVNQFVICRPYDDFLRPLRDAGIPVETVDFNKWNKWLMKRWIPWKVFRRIKSFLPDVVHCWKPQAAEWTPTGSGVPVLGWFGGYLDMKHHRHCDYWMGCAPDLADWIGRESGHPDRVFMLNTFVSLQGDEPLSREEFGIPADKPVILFLGRMVKEKGVDTLLRASVDLDVFLLLAGDGGELDTYRILARDLGIESRVRFLGWRKDISALLEISDILAVPSRDEPFGTVMPEAWSKNVPVVATKTKGPSQYINHGVNGMLSEIDDVDGLRENLRAVLEDTKLRERLVNEGKRTYETQFTEDVVIAKLLETYQEIIRRGVV